MNFGQLKSKVALYLNRDDLAAQIGDFINMTIHRVEKENSGFGNWKCMEKREIVTTSEAYIFIPQRFKEAIWFKVKDGDRYYDLQKTSPKHALNLYPYPDSGKGRPVIFSTIKATNEFLVRPTPDKFYTFDLYYYVYSPDLSADTDTNWWTENAWEILLYGALGEAEPYLVNDSRIVVWKGFFDLAVARLRNAEQAETFSSYQAIRKGANI